MSSPEFNSGAVSASDCIGGAWALVPARYWMYFGISLAVVVPIACLPILNWILFGPLMAGIYYVALRDMKGEPVEFAMMFKGFENFLPLMAIGILQNLPTILITLSNIVFQFFLVTRGGVSELESGDFTAYQIFIVLLWCVNILWSLAFTFAIPLVLDRGLGVMEAATTSFRAVMANLGGIILLYISLFLILAAGALVFCIGALFVLPIVYVSFAFAYRSVFPDTEEKKGFDMPPPPEAYYGTFGEAM